jgi:hypothetical protein
VAVLVPRRSDGGHRDRLWAWLADRWAAEHPDWPVAEGHHRFGPFNRSAAVNAAATAAGDWQVAVIADADTFAGPHQLTAAVTAARVGGRVTFAYDRYCHLSRTGTEQILAGHPGPWEPFVEWSMAGTCSSMVVLTRDLWDRAGGFDPGFVGWGMEDVAFSLACQSLGGGFNRIPGPVWHLYHPPSPENADTPLFRANVERLELYRRAHVAGPAGMARLLTGHGLSHPAPVP